MSIYVPTTFGLLIKVGEKERKECRKSTEFVSLEEEGGGTIYFNLFLWELEKQLEIQTSRRSHDELTENENKVSIRKDLLRNLLRNVYCLVYL